MSKKIIILQNTGENKYPFFRIQILNNKVKAPSLGYSKKKFVWGVEEVIFGKVDPLDFNWHRPPGHDFANLWPLDFTL